MNQVAPNPEDASALQFSYVCLGLRGRRLDGNVDYWISPLAGDNGISANRTPRVKPTEASLVFYLILHARAE